MSLAASTDVLARQWQKVKDGVTRALIFPAGMGREWHKHSCAGKATSGRTAPCSAGDCQHHPTGPQGLIWSSHPIISCLSLEYSGLVARHWHNQGVSLQGGGSFPHPRPRGLGATAEHAAGQRGCSARAARLHLLMESPLGTPKSKVWPKHPHPDTTGCREQRGVSSSTHPKQPEGAAIASSR